MQKREGSITWNDSIVEAIGRIVGDDRMIDQRIVGACHASKLWFECSIMAPAIRACGPEYFFVQPSEVGGRDGFQIGIVVVHHVGEFAVWIFGDFGLTAENQQQQCEETTKS